LKKLQPITFITLLLISSAFILYVNVKTAKATFPTHQGNLILNENNVTLIEGNFNINGSIIIQENATLILRNALVNFTQTFGYQFNITLSKPDGNPRILIENTTINANNKMYMHVYGNSSAKISKLTAPDVALNLNDDSTTIIDESTIYRMGIAGNTNINMSNSLLMFDLGTYDNSSIEISNSTLGSIHAEGGYTVNLSNSTIKYHLAPRAYSANISITELQPGFFTYWNFRLNCSVTVAKDGKASNITLTNTQVNGWLLYLWRLSKATINNSRLKDIFAYDLTAITINNSIIYSIHAYDNAYIETYNSIIYSADLYENSKLWLINSTSDSTQHYDKSTTYIASILSIHVIDSIDQNVPLANVTATYENGTIADKALTSMDGTATLKLIEKIINASSEQTIKNYNINATYQTYSTTTRIDITENKEIILKLENLIVPELSLTTILLLLTAITIFTVKKKVWLDFYTEKFLAAAARSIRSIIPSRFKSHATT
jgi:hypothetical protein